MSRRSVVRPPRLWALRERVSGRWPGGNGLAWFVSRNGQVESPPHRMSEERGKRERLAGERKASDLRLFGLVLLQARPYWPHIIASFLLSLLATPLALLTPLPLKIAVDSVLGDHPVPGFLAWALPAGATSSDSAILLLAVGLMVATTVLSQLHNIVTGMLLSYTGEKLVLDFRSHLFRHVQRLSLVYHDAKGTADATYRIQYDTYAIQTIALNGVIPFFVSIFTFGSMFLIVLRIDAGLTLVALAVAPAFFVLTHVYRPRVRRRSKQVKRLESSALSVVQEVLGALRVVKAFGQEDFEHERFVSRSTEGLRARLTLTLVQYGYSTLVTLTTVTGTAIVLYVGIRHVQEGVLTLGSLLLVMSYLSQLYSPLKTLSKKFVSLQSSLVSAERVFSVLDTETDVPERPDARPLARARGNVVFQGVSFGYDEERPVLHRISFEVEPGAQVGIAGATGAGKTTLVSLLTRFYDPTEGRILLDGVDLRDYKLADLRNQFAIVLQEPVLFSRSIAENIAYARPDASFEEIVAAAKAASVHDFIRSLPEGYDTPVGERGMRLSGGERQRISLARAFLRDAPILILDEPTSSVDVKTERLIMDAMDRLTTGRTSFMIAHRLSTLANCDLRIEMDHGRLVEARFGRSAMTSRTLVSAPVARVLGRPHG